MNNKKGGFGAKLLLVLVLMIASAVGGAYGYRVLDGKLASRDALKAVENVDISDYDAPEQSEIQGFIDDARKNLETAKTRKEVYDVITDFIADVDKVQTMNEKKLEEALRAAEEAKNQYGNNNNSNQNQNQLFNPGDSSNTTDNSNSYNNDADTGDDATEEEKDDGGFLGSLIGGMSNGSNGN